MKLRILLVDNDPALSQILTALGHNVSVARNVKQALSQLAEYADLVIINLQSYGRMSGEWLIRHIRRGEEESDTPLPVIVTSETSLSEESRGEICRMGASCVLQKSVSGDILRIAISDVMKTSVSP